MMPYVNLFIISFCQNENKPVHWIFWILISGTRPNCCSHLGNVVKGFTAQNEAKFPSASAPHSASYILSAVDTLSAVHTWIARAANEVRSVYCLTLLSQPVLTSELANFSQPFTLDETSQALMSLNPRQLCVINNCITLLLHPNRHRQHTWASSLLQSMKNSRYCALFCLSAYLAHLDSSVCDCYTTICVHSFSAHPNSVAQLAIFSAESVNYNSADG